VSCRDPTCTVAAAAAARPIDTAVKPISTSEYDAARSPARLSTRVTADLDH